MDPETLKALILALRAGNQQAQPTVDPMTSLEALTPEQLQTSFAPYQQKNDALERQMAMAQTLRNKTMAPRTTPLGAALGGLGHVLTGVTGTVMGNQAEAGQSALAGQMQHDAVDRVQAYVNYLKRKGVMDRFSAAPPPMPF